MPDFSVLNVSNQIKINLLSDNLVIYLPSSPNKGDQYLIKDVDGYIGQYYVIVDGYGKTIDNKSTVTMFKPFSSLTLQYTGDQWSIISNYEGTLCIVPKLSDFTWENQGPATGADFGDGIFIYAPDNNSAHDLRVLWQDAPTTPYTVTTKFKIFGGGFGNGIVYSMGIHISDGTKFITNSVWNQGHVTIASWDNFNTFNGNYFVSTADNTISSVNWLRVSDDGSTRTFQFSKDGINWITTTTIPSSEFLTTSKVGLFFDSYDGVLYGTFNSWKVS